jgi:hypothetical protein
MTMGAGGIPSYDIWVQRFGNEPMRQSIPQFPPIRRHLGVTVPGDFIDPYDVLPLVGRPFRTKFEELLKKLAIGCWLENTNMTKFYTRPPACHDESAGLGLAPSRRTSYWL